MRQSNLFSRSILRGSIGLAVLCLGVSEVKAQSVKVQFESEAVIEVPLDSALVNVPQFLNGQWVITPMVSYTGTFFVAEPSLPNANHKITYSIKVPVDNGGGYDEKIFKDAIITVETAAAATSAHNFTVELSVPTVPFVNILLKGAGSIKTVANTDGASLNCSTQPAPTKSLLTPLFDGLSAPQTVGNPTSPTCEVIYCPFNMGLTGAGSATTNFQLTDSCQYLKPFSVDSTVGLRFRLNLTPGDKAIAKIDYVVAAAPACLGDFNGDSEVDEEDLGIMLGSWGTTGSNFDLNGDGVVDSGDFGLFLGMLGPCPK